MEIKEIRERLALIEELANKYGFKFEEIDDYVDLDSKICIFPFFDKKSKSLCEVGLFQKYSKIFAIVENENNREYGVINLISKNILKKVIDSDTLGLDDLFLSYITNDYDKLLFLETTKKSTGNKKEKGTHILEKGININPLVASYDEIGKRVFYSKETNQYVLLLESKSYDRNKYKNYWYSIHQYQIELLHGKKSYVLFQFKDSNDYACIPFEYLESKFSKLGKTVNAKETYYHIYIDRYEEKGYFLRIPNEGRESVNEYVNMVGPKIKENNTSRTVIKIKTDGLKEVIVKGHK